MLQEWLSWPQFCVANCQLYGSATFEAGSLFDLIVKSFVGSRLFFCLLALSGNMITNHWYIYKGETECLEVNQKQMVHIQKLVWNVSVCRQSDISDNYQAHSEVPPLTCNPYEKKEYLSLSLSLSLSLCM